MRGKRGVDGGRGRRPHEAICAVHRSADGPMGVAVNPAGGGGPRPGRAPGCAFSCGAHGGEVSTAAALFGLGRIAALGNSNKL